MALAIPFFALLFFIYYPEATIFVGIVIGIVMLCIYIANNKKEKEKANEELKKKEEWIKDLRNGKQVEIRICKINFEGNNIRINDDLWNLKDVNKLEFKERLINVKKYSYYSTGGLMRIDTMTVEEYNRDLQYNLKHYFPDKRYSYDFFNEYYVSVEFNKNSVIRCTQAVYSIGYHINKEDQERLEKINNVIAEKTGRQI